MGHIPFRNRRKNSRSWYTKGVTNSATAIIGGIGLKISRLGVNLSRPWIY